MAASDRFNRLFECAPIKKCRLVGADLIHNRKQTCKNICFFAHEN